MASQFDVVFAIKQKFDDDTAADIISNLRCHPAIWRYLSKENSYLRIATILGEEQSNWKATNIIDTLISDFSSADGLSLSVDLQEIVNSIQLIQSTIESTDWKTVILRSLANENRDQTQKFDKWGTIFSYFFTKDQNPYDLVAALMESGTLGIEIIAFLIKNRVIENDRDFLTGSLQRLLSKPAQLLEISEQLAIIDSIDHAKNIIRTYFELTDSAEKEIVNKNESKSKPLDISLEIQRLVELGGLAKFIKDEEKEKKFLAEASGLVQTLSNYIANEELIDFSLLDKARNLQDTDKDNARSLYLEWIHKNETTNGYRSIARLSIENIQEIVSNFISVDLHIPIILFIEKILAYTGRKPELEKLIGDVCAVYGDQARVIKYFLPLNGEGVLSRDQKIKLTNAFVYYEDWKSAEIVFRSVNLLSTADKLFALLCNLKADPQFDLGLSIKDLSAANPKSQAFTMLQRTMIGEKIEMAIFSRLPDSESEFVLWILYEYFLKAGKNKLLSFLAEVNELSLLSKYLYIKHFSTLLPSSDVNSLYSNLINTGDINDQMHYEKIVNDLMEKGLDHQLEKILNRNSWKWPLSKVNFYNVIIRQLNDQNFSQVKSRLEWAIVYFPPDNTLVTLYGAYILRATIHELPFSLQNHTISDGEKTKFEKLLNNIGDQELSLDNQILKIEILSNAKTNDYLKLGTTEFEDHPLNRWKVLRALGNHFFHQKKYDQAIIYLSEARKIIRTSDSGFQTLLNSLIKLKMYDEASCLIEDEFEADKSFTYESLRKLSESLYENDRFYRFLKVGEAKEPINIIQSLVLVRVFILRGMALEASNLLTHLEENINQKDTAMLDLADLYHEAGEEISSKRILDTYLSNKQDLNDRDLIRSAILFFDLSLYEKSLNILTLIDDQMINIEFARSSIYSIIGEMNLASKALLQGVLNPERKLISNILDKSFIPESWMSLDETLLEKIIIDFIRAGETDALSSLLENIKRQAEENLKLIPVICNTAQLTGDFGCLDGFSVDEPHHQNIELLPVVIARITEGLIQAHEIEAALLFSNVDRTKINSPLLELLEIRLQIRQNQLPKIGDRVNTILEEIVERKTGLRIEDENKLDALVFQLNLAEGLLENHQFIKAYSHLKNIILEIGFTPRIAACYREIMENIFLEKRINELLLIKNHDLRLDDEDEEIFANYLAAIEGKEGPILGIGEPSANPLESHGDFADQFMRSDSASNTSIDADLITLVSSLEEKPNEAIKRLTNLLKLDGNNPRLLFALGLAYRQINDYIKSYAPIRLALEVWPDEYAWQEIAADLCEKNGDNLNAARHRSLIQQHAGLNSKSNSDNYQYIQNLIDECVFGDKDIPGRDLSKLLEYAENLARWNCEDIAARIVSRILEISPKNMRAQILNIEIFLKQKNFSKIEDFLSQFRRDHPDELIGIELQIRYLIAIDELQAAFDLLAKNESQEVSLAGKLPLFKAEILEKQEGVDIALDFLREQVEQSKEVSFIQEAVAYLIRKNDFQSAQSNINRLLQFDSNNSESLFIAGKLAEAVGDLDQALAYYNRAITINPFIGKFYIACSDLHETRRQFDLAKKLLEEGVRHNPNDFTLLKYVGFYFKQIGKDQYSVDCLRRAYTINRYDQDLRNTMQSEEEKLNI